MYKEFYNFKENPFNMTSDPAFYFSSARHSEALSHLLYGIDQRKGIIVITGEIGTGKTTLCRTLLNQVDSERTKTALILNPNFSEIQLLQLIIKDLGITGNYRRKLDIVNALNDFLLRETALGNNIVIIVDESQNLSVKQLEQIRLLSNLETEKEKLLQIILVGQPELMDMLKLSSLRQINQRVSVRYHMLPLQKDELTLYIDHRINVAWIPDESKKKVQFTQDAIDAIYRHSKGTPRLINALCDRALLSGYVDEKFIIDEAIVNKCMREVVKHT